MFSVLDGPLPGILHEVSLPIINNNECEGMYQDAGYIEHIPYIFICAGFKEGGKDSCEVTINYNYDYEVIINYNCKF